MCNENEHKLAHLDTKKHVSYNGFSSTFTRIDQFFCEKCGAIIIKKRKECHRDTPDWY